MNLDNTIPFRYLWTLRISLNNVELDLPVASQERAERFIVRHDVEISFSNATVSFKWPGEAIFPNNVTNVTEDRLLEMRTLELEE
jgi:hypothetical protein